LGTKRATKRIAANGHFPPFASFGAVADLPGPKPPVGVNEYGPERQA
jgi:hypothetical protein